MIHVYLLHVFRFIIFDLPLSTDKITMKVSACNSLRFPQGCWRFEPLSICFPADYLCLKCLSAQVSNCPFCASKPRVLKCPLSPQVHFESSWSDLRVPFKCPWNALWVPNFPLKALRLKGVCNITRNGLANSFIGLLKSFQNTYFTQHLLSYSSLKIRCVTFSTFC